MPSLAQRHQAKMRAQQASRQAGKAAATTKAAPPQSTDGAAGQEYAALLAVMHEDVRTISDIASQEARQPKKAEMAVKYYDWIDGVLEADAPVQDEILVTVMIWALDYRDFENMLTLARFGLKHGLTLPERYNRTLACFLAEDVAFVALGEALTKGEEVPHEVLTEVEALTAEHDMPDQARAKLHKALSRSWTAKADAFKPTDDNAAAGGERAYLDEALTHAERALKLDDKSGVKTDIKKLKKRIAKLTPQETAE